MGAAIENEQASEEGRVTDQASNLMDALSKIIENGNNFKSFSASKLPESPESLTICIDADFGAGKTTFCHTLNDHLAKNYTVLYVDAFKYDYMQDPLQSLVNQILTQKAGKVESFMKDFALIINGLVKAAIACTPAAPLSNAVGSGLDYLSSGQKNAQDFKQSLQKIFKDKNTIVIIDELDRCRPDYAITLLEIVKHLFNIESISFIFSVNLNALNQSIQKAYGYDQHTANHYIDRFFTTRLKLKHKPIVPDIIEQFLKEEFSNNDVEGNNTDTAGYIEKFKHVVDIFLNECTARDIKILLNHAKHWDRLSPVGMLFCALKYKNPDALKALIDAKHLEIPTKNENGRTMEQQVTPLDNEFFDILLNTFSNVKNIKNNENIRMICHDTVLNIMYIFYWTAFDNRRNTPINFSGNVFSHFAPENIRQNPGSFDKTCIASYILSPKELLNNKPSTWNGILELLNKNYKSLQYVSNTLDDLAAQ